MGSSIQPIIVRFQAQGAPQVNAAFQGVQKQAATTSTTINRTFVDGGGKVTAFGRQSVQALNATGFAVSQLAATGQTGFRSLASATAGFASFFGPAGLIATGVISLGLVLGDFWQRQRKEIEETKRFITTGLGEVAARRARVDPVGVATDALEEARKEIEKNQQAMADLFDIEKRTVQLRDAIIVRPVDQQALAALAKQRGELLAIEDSRLRALNEAQAAANKTTAAGTQAKGAANTAARDAERALEAEIDALVQLGRQNQLSVADLSRLIDLQEQFTKSVRDGTLSLEERAAASKRLLDTERGIVIPVPKVGDITETRTTRAPGPATTLPAPKIPPVVAPDTAPVANAFGDAFSQSLQTGLASGVTQFLASGSIEGMWNTVGSSIVAGLATINPWFAVAGGILQGLIGSLFGGNDPRPTTAPLPIDIRRVVNDPGGRAPRAMQPVHVEVVGANSPRGQRILGTANRRFVARGGR